jgi:ParB family transcriptional regulator, chromosome partitioning protein
MEFFSQKIVNVEDLIPYALNSRTHSDAQVAQLAASIREFGFTNPVLVDEQNNLIAGHGRLLAARKLKLTEVPAVVVTGLDDRKRRALVIADNKLALNAEWDEEALRVELEDLAGDFGELMGFSEDELVALLKTPDFAPGTEDDQGKLDELAPKMVTCPHCQIEWDLREHGQG